MGTVAIPCDGVKENNVPCRQRADAELLLICVVGHLWHVFSCPDCRTDPELLCDLDETPLATKSAVELMTVEGEGVVRGRRIV